jgi:hypothetical protein
MGENKILIFPLSEGSFPLELGPSLGYSRVFPTDPSPVIHKAKLFHRRK